MTCAPYRRLLAAYVTGRLPAPDAQVVAMHIGLCPDCAATVVDMMPAAEWLDANGTPAAGPVAERVPAAEGRDSTVASLAQSAPDNPSEAKRASRADMPVVAPAREAEAVWLPFSVDAIPRSRLTLLVTIVCACVVALTAWYRWRAGDEAATPARWLLQEHAAAQYRASGATVLGPMLSTLEMGEAP